MWGWGQILIFPVILDEVLENLRFVEQILYFGLEILDSLGFLHTKQENLIFGENLALILGQFTAVGTQFSLFLVYVLL